MEGRGGCCIARYAAAGVYDMSKVDRIMLRFRPIAPKPVSGGSASPERKGSEVFSKTGRGKRRHSKDGGVNMCNTANKRCNRKKRVSSEEKRVTLPLLPETPDCKEAEKGGVVGNTKPNSWLNFGQTDDRKVGLLGVAGSADLTSTAGVNMAPVVGSCVTVECVTEMWASGGDGLGCTDEDRKVALARDTCPGFISDGMWRVKWINGAYKEMVGGEMMVWLVVKESLPMMITYPAFTCRVRVQYTCGKERSSLMVPCDVWRMDGGGFAWRLDTNAALCLGR